MKKNLILNSPDNSICLFGKFLEQVILKDFHPERGQQNNLDYFFQCKLHVYGSFSILFIFFLSGFIFLGFYNGLQNYVNSMKNNPFTMVIKITKYSNKKDLSELEKLFYNLESKSFELNNINNGIPVINRIYPFYTQPLRFLDKKMKRFVEMHDVLVIRVPGEKNNKIGSDVLYDYINKNLRFKKKIFSPETDVKNEIILSPSLYEKIYLNKQHEYNNNMKVYFEDLHKDLSTERIREGVKEIWEKPLTKKEIFKFTNDADLIGVLDSYPGFDAIISEGYYYHLSNKFYYTGKPVKRFYIKLEEGKFSEPNIKEIEKWAYEQFGIGSIEPIDPLFQMSNEITIQFTSDANKLTSKDNIESQFNKLEHKKGLFALEFNEEGESNDYFYIKQKNEIFTQNDLSKIKSWADKYFGKGAIKKLPESEKSNQLTIEFTSDAKEWTGKYNILWKFTELQKIMGKISLDFNEDLPSYYGHNKKYFYTLIYINKDPVILNNVSALIHYIGKKYGAYLEANQLITLSNYLKYIQRMDIIFYYILAGFTILLLIYVLVTFTLLLQTKRHQIGIFKAMGGSSLRIVFIYVCESLLLISLPILITFLISYFFPPGEIYAVNWIYLTFYIMLIVLLTVIGAVVSALNIVRKPPYQLIQYQT